MEINPEVIYKAMLLRGRIEEIPAHLDWRLQNTAGPKRKSSMRVLRHTMSTLFSGFLFKPFMFFIIPGLGLLLFSLYVNAWMLAHFFAAYQKFPSTRGSSTGPRRRWPLPIMRRPTPSSWAS